MGLIIWSNRYYSQVRVGDAPQICTWIDADQTATDVVGFQVHFPEFTFSNGTVGTYKEDLD